MPGPRTNPRFANNIAPGLHKKSPAVEYLALARQRDDRPNGLPGNRYPSPSDPANANMTPEEKEFIEAMLQYRQSSGRMFPTWSEVLEVLQKLGYHKVDSDKPETPSARS
ncbi:hypothetical protein [Singulisphaera sp. PoT]|uniref:hypothetical protein n=1 Tax=Singulisphaera sp. PoT TaxID=3411797 RepID=UPI003BF494C5